MNEMASMLSRLPEGISFYDYIKSAASGRAPSEARIVEDASNERRRAAEFREFLNENDSSEVPALYYISDLHLDTQLLRYLGQKEVRMQSELNDLTFAYLRELAYGLLRDDEGREIQFRNHSYLVICGDLARRFLLSEIFLCALADGCRVLRDRGRRSPKIVFILGNHELSNQNYDTFASISDAAEAYRALCERLGFIFLENEILCTDGEVMTIRNLSHLASEELNKKINAKKFAIFGAMAAGGLNDDKDHSYGDALASREAEKEYSNTISKSYRYLLDNFSDCRILIASHTPIEDWTRCAYCENFYYLNGHTHHDARNKSLNSYADNQIGKYGKRIKLCAINLE